MELEWISGFILSWIVLIDCVPVEYVFTGDACECPKKLGYALTVPNLPIPKPVLPYAHGYKVDVPPIQKKAKVTYTFDFTVEEPKLPCPLIEPKLDLYTKIDRVALPKEDCRGGCGARPLLPAAAAYAASYAAPPPLPARCGCSKCGLSKPFYRYVNGKWIPIKSKCSNCNCQLQRRKTPHFTADTINAIDTPIMVASGPLADHSKNSIRRKRDLRSFFFGPRQQYLARPERYVKLYNKDLPQEEQEWFDLPQKKRGLFGLDLFSDANPFKRKTKKFFFPHTGARIVKRDIKGEYDLLKKEREAADLTLPDIIQFMPETLQPDFKRRPCQFGCRESCMHARQLKNTAETEEKREQLEKEIVSNNAKLTEDTEKTSNIDDENEGTVVDNIENDDGKNEIDDDNVTPSFTKRNAAAYGYQHTAAPPTAFFIPESVYAADYGALLPPAPPAPPAPPLPPPPQSFINPNYKSRPAPPQSPCEQRKYYAALRRADEAQQNYANERRLLVPMSSSVPDPFAIGGAPLHYAGDLEIPQIGYTVHSAANPIVGARHLPVQTVPGPVLDRIISDIVYRHPDFIDATSHYGGALVDPDPYQEQETKDFIKRLIDGRLSIVFGEPAEQYLPYFPAPSFSGRSYNPYVPPRTLTLYPMY